LSATTLLLLDAELGAATLVAVANLGDEFGRTVEELATAAFALAHGSVLTLSAGVVVVSLFNFVDRGRAQRSLGLEDFLRGVRASSRLAAGGGDTRSRAGGGT